MSLCQVDTSLYSPSPACGEGARALKDLEPHVCGHSPVTYPPPYDTLGPQLGARIFHRWSRPCEAMFEYLAENYPTALVQLVQDGALRYTDLTFAAEIVGRLDDSPVVRKTLEPLLSHREAVVREGAIYGLGNHLNDDSRNLLRFLFRQDNSPAVRSAAADALGEE